MDAMTLNGSWFRSNTAQRQEEAAAAHVAGAQHKFVRELVLHAEVEVVGVRRALRVQHGAEGVAKIVAQARWAN